MSYCSNNLAKKPRSLKLNQTWFKQNGTALIFLIFLISLVATGVVIKSLNTSNSVKATLDDKAAKTLADAKDALIGYTLSRVGAGERPGDMPRPDYFGSTEAPANYDGDIDGGCMDATQSDGLPMTNNGTNMRCLGRLPWKAIGMSIPSPSQNDAIGIMPWYAVSANLVDPTCFVDTDVGLGLNPLVLNMTYSTYECDNASTLPHPRLTVRDARGNVLSDRVAIVLILPGAAINGQSRPSAPLNGAASYLDTVIVPATCTAPCVPGTYSNSDTNNDFIMAAGITGSVADTNDRMLYVTIDELMSELVKRAAAEAKQGLKKYDSLLTVFPNATPLGSTGNNFIAGAGSTGMLPADGTHSASCSSSDSCTYSFSNNVISSVAHTRTSGSSYTSSTGACSYSGRACTCTGSGRCDGSLLTRFQCTATTCTHSYLFSGGGKRFIFTPNSSTIEVVSTTGSCSINVTNADCTGAGSFRLSFILADWFRDNLWKEYFYYRWDNTSNIQVGDKTGIETLLIGTGSQITTAPFALSTSTVVPLTPVTGNTQTRPSINTNNYLDSTENANGDLVFDATNTVRSSNYNDQTFIIAP